MLKLRVCECVFKIRFFIRQIKVGSNYYHRDVVYKNSVSYYSCKEYGVLSMTLSRTIFYRLFLVVVQNDNFAPPNVYALAHYTNTYVAFSQICTAYLSL